MENSDKWKDLIGVASILEVQSIITMVGHGGI